MTIDDTAAYQVLLARDARFDGKLFVGVTSTGVYCRPICRVRTPARRNCRFFATPAQAEAASFRPCLKCRPEIAPGPGLAWTVMDASRTLAVQAARLLDAQAHGADDGGDDGDAATPRLAALAERLGISDRHVRRIFIAEHGSWNRKQKHGYRIKRVTVDPDGKNAKQEIFAGVWLDGQKITGRPADIQIAPDGSMLIADDQAGAIYQITYGK